MPETAACPCLCAIAPPQRCASGPFHPQALFIPLRVFGKSKSCDGLRGDPLRGPQRHRAVDLVEGLSCRVPGPEVAKDDRWLVDGLSQIFNSAA